MSAALEASVRLAPRSRSLAPDKSRLPTVVMLPPRVVVPPPTALTVKDCSAVVLPITPRLTSAAAPIPVLMSRSNAPSRVAVTIAIRSLSAVMVISFPSTMSRSFCPSVMVMLPSANRSPLRVNVASVLAAVSVCTVMFPPPAVTSVRVTLSPASFTQPWAAMISLPSCMIRSPPSVPSAFGAHVLGWSKPPLGGSLVPSSSAKMPMLPPVDRSRPSISKLPVAQPVMLPLAVTSPASVAIAGSMATLRPATLVAVISPLTATLPAVSSSTAKPDAAFAPAVRLPVVMWLVVSAPWTSSEIDSVETMSSTVMVPFPTTVAVTASRAVMSSSVSVPLPTAVRVTASAAIVPPPVRSRPSAKSIVTSLSAFTLPVNARFVLAMPSRSNQTSCVLSMLPAIVTCVRSAPPPPDRIWMLLFTASAGPITSELLTSIVPLPCSVNVPSVAPSPTTTSSRIPGATAPPMVMLSCASISMFCPATRSESSPTVIAPSATLKSMFPGAARPALAPMTRSPVALPPV